jgi:hypothetical protein
MKRGQVDYQTIEFDGYKWMLNYQDHTTKLLILCALKCKEARAVARVLVTEVFAYCGAPLILQSDNGPEFVAKIIRELKNLYPGLILVNGRPRHPQSQGSVANADIKNMLSLWLKDNNSKDWP